MMEKLLVIKIGGNIIDSKENLDHFIKSFSSIPHKKILVHGGGKVASHIGAKLGIESKYIDGRRITDDATLDLVTMVYGGLLNKQMVASLQALGCNAIGLTGADANIIPATKRPVKTIDYGWAGDVDEKTIQASTLQNFLDAGLAPVCAPLTHDGKGRMLNTNADTIASVLAISLSAKYDVRLIYCFERSGVLFDEQDNQSVIKRIDREHFEQLKNNGTLHSGILPKIENALQAIEKGVSTVWIGHADDILANTGPEFKGTIIE